MKCYGRRAKLPGRSLRGMHHTAGMDADREARARAAPRWQPNHDLLAADLNAFLKRNLRLARVDHVAVGKLFKVRRGRNRALPISRGGALPIFKQWQDPKYRARRAAFLVLRLLAYRESARLGEEHALHVCQESPAQVRGYLRGLRPGGKPLTDYRINNCFRPVRLLPV